MMPTRMIAPVVESTGHVARLWMNGTFAAPIRRTRPAEPLCCFSNIIVPTLHLTHRGPANTHSSIGGGNRRLPSRRCLIGWRRVWTVSCRTCATCCGR